MAVEAIQASSENTGSGDGNTNDILEQVKSGTEKVISWRDKPASDPVHAEIGLTEGESQDIHDTNPMIDGG